MKSMVLLLVLVLVGCAAMFHGTTDTVSVRSTAPGRRVLVDGLERGVTPLEVELDSDRSHTVVVEPSPQWGGATSTTVINRSFSAGYLVLDILFTGLLGIVVDAATGAWWSLGPDEVFAPR